MKYQRVENYVRWHFHANKLPGGEIYIQRNFPVVIFTAARFLVAKSPVTISYVWYFDWTYTCQDRSYGWQIWNIHLVWSIVTRTVITDYLNMYYEHVIRNFKFDDCVQSRCHARLIGWTWLVRVWYSLST